MPADDITVKKIPALGGVAIGASAPGYRPDQVIPSVNRSRVQFDELGIPGLVTVTGPYMLFFEDNKGDDITVYVALPVAEPPAELPPPAQYLVLPAIEAVVAVRNGPAAGIFPAVYQDLVRYATAHGYETHGPGRDIWINEIDDVSQVEEQVFEIQVAFTRPPASPA